MLRRQQARVAIAEGFVLSGKPQAALKIGQPIGLRARPIGSAVGIHQIAAKFSELFPILDFVARRANDDDLLDTALEGLFRDDLDDGFGQAVSIQ